jgi:hypothetical protein
VPLNPNDALTAVRTVLAARFTEYPRLARIERAMRPGANSIAVPTGSPDALRRAA